MTVGEVIGKIELAESLIESIEQKDNTTESVYLRIRIPETMCDEDDIITLLSDYVSILRAMKISK